MWKWNWIFGFSSDSWSVALLGFLPARALINAEQLKPLELLNSTELFGGASLVLVRIIDDEVEEANNGAQSI